MSTVEATKKKRVFIAASRSDSAEIEKALQQYGLEAVTLDRDAVPGTSWVDSMQRCVQDADMVVGVMGDRKRDTNVFFELGVARALNKPSLLLIPPDYPLEILPPSGIPYLRTDMRNQNAILFGLEQMLSIPPRENLVELKESLQTRPIGPLGDQLLSRLTESLGRENQLVEIIYEAIKASGVATISRGREAGDKVIDLAVWSNDLEPTIANPLLVECKCNLKNQADVNEAFGRLVRALDVIPNGCGLVIYQDTSPKASKAAPKSWPIIFVSAEEFLKGLRDTGFAALVRRLRNTVAHGF